MNRKPGVEGLFILLVCWTIWLWEQFWSFMYAWTHLLSCVSIGYTKKHVTLICVRVAMARRKSGEAHLTQGQVASCQLSPWFSDNFCWPFWNWSWSWQGRIPADEAWPEWYEFGLPTPVFGTRFSTRRTVQLYIFTTKPTKVRQFSIPLGCSKTLPT